jgi:tetratricopeptide (TPR) repeat protein
MIELLQNLFGGKIKPESDSDLGTLPSSMPQSLESKIEEADRLWQNGKVGEAIVLYRQAIKQHPQSTKTYEHLYGLLKQHENIAEVYTKLAADLKKQGQIEQAASCYRQAIDLKTLTVDARERLVASKLLSGSKPPQEIPNLQDTAFSFQPLSSNSPLESNNSVSIDLEQNNSLKSKIFTDEIPNLQQHKVTQIEWETAHIYIQQALDYYTNQKWEEVIASCEKAIQILPKMAEVYKIRGNALQRLGRTSEAMKCYDRALEIQPDLAEIYAGIGKLYALQQQWQTAIKYYQKAIIIKPDFIEAYRNLATIWIQLGKPEIAKNNRERASELESKSPSQIAAAKSTLTIERDLETNLTKEIARSNSNPIETYRQVARNLERQQKWQEAAICYRKALDFELTQQLSGDRSSQTPLTRLQKPTQADRLSEKTINALPARQPTTESFKFSAEENQLDKAIRRYYHQAQLQPNSAKIRTDLGNLYARKQAWDLAIECYRQAIELNPQDYRAYLNLARIYSKIGKQAEFIEYISLALSIKPNVAAAVDYLHLGNAWFDREQLERAISSYRQAIALKPNYGKAYHRLGTVLSKQGKSERAIASYDKAIELNPEDATAYYSLGNELENQPRWDGAVKAYSRVLQLEPRFPNASGKLNYALSKKIEFELASKKN